MKRLESISPTPMPIWGHAVLFSTMLLLLFPFSHPACTFREIALYNFESNTSGFVNTTSSGSGGWQWGANMSGDPPPYNSSTRYWGTVLGGSYYSSANYILRSPSFNLSAMEAPINLSFYHVFYTESRYDGGIVEVSLNNGSTWTKLTPVTNYSSSTCYANSGFSAGTCYTGQSTGWPNTYQLALFNLSAYAGNQSIIVRWHFGSDGSGNYRGWYMDNVNLSACINLETEPPIVTLNYPDEAAAISDEPSVFNFTATDNASQTMNCRLMINGSLAAENASVLNNTPTSFSVSGLSNGMYNWSVNCTDQSFNYNMSETRNLTISAAIPLVSVDSPANGSLFMNDQPLEFNFTAISAVPGAMNCSLLINGSAAAQNSSVQNNTPTAYSITPRPIGGYNFTILCRDAKNNVNSSEMRFFSVGFSPPSITLSAPPDDYVFNAGPITFNFTTVDDFSATTNCTLLIDSISSANNASVLNNTPASFASPTLGGGDHLWNITCRDNSLNSNTSETRNFTWNITNCPVIDTPGAIVTLSSNHTGFPNAVPATGLQACIVISAPNVILDCDGNSILGNGTANTAGILVNGSAYNATIRNCPRIYRYGYGVVLHSSQNDSVDNVTAINSTSAGFYATASSRSSMSGSSALNSTYYGFRLVNSPDSTLTGNFVNRSWSSYDIDSSSSRANLTGNTAYLGFWGVNLSSSWNYLLNNTITNHTVGFRIAGVSNILLNNSAFLNRNWSTPVNGGYYITSDNNTLIGNVANNSYDVGFYLIHHATFNRLINNTASNTYNSGGFELENSSSYNILSDNIAYKNYNGFVIQYESNYNNLTNNTAANNSAYGFYSFPGVCPYCGQEVGNIFYRNTAFGNGFTGLAPDIGGFFLSGTWLGTLSTSPINNNLTENSAYSNKGNCFTLVGYNNTLDHNNASYCTGTGFDLQAIIGYSPQIGMVNLHNTTITNNTAWNNSGGFFMNLNSNLYIADNLAYNNSDNGFSLTRYYGNYLKNVTLVNNTAYHNLKYGFFIDDDNYSLINNTMQENVMYDLYIAAQYVGGSYNITGPFCNNVITGNTGSAGRPILFTNETVNWSGLHVAELILCGANNSVLTNITVNGSDTYDNNALFILATSNATVRDSISKDNYYGMYMISNTDGAYRECSKNNVTNTTLQSNMVDGLYMDHASLNNISFSNITGNNLTGISLWHSYSNTLEGNSIVNNTLSGSNAAVYVRQSSNNAIIGNYLERNAMGPVFRPTIYLFTSDNCSIIGNTLVGNYLAVSNSGANNSILYNLVTNNSYSVSSSGALANISYNTVNDTGVNTDAISSSGVNSTITFNNVTNNHGSGIYTNAGAAYIAGNNVADNAYTGIYSYVSSGIPAVFEWNSVSGGSVGIYTYGNSSGSPAIVRNNVVSNSSSYGIQANYYVNVTNNTVIGCHSGLYIDSYNVTASQNALLRNRYYGVFVNYNARDNRIFGNNASENNLSGYYLDQYSTRNLLYDTYAGGNNMSGFYMTYNSRNNTLRNVTSVGNIYGVYVEYYVYNLTINDSVLQENQYYDMYLMHTSAPFICNMTFSNNTGSGGRPIQYYFNSPVSLSGNLASEIIICSTNDSVVNGVNVSGSDTLRNNGLIAVDLKNLTILNSSLDGNYAGVLLLQGANVTITGISASNGHYGVLLNSTRDTPWPNRNVTVQGFAISGSDVAGIDIIGRGPINVSDLVLFNNTWDFQTDYYPSNSYLNATNITFAPPSGAMENYTTLNFSTVVYQCGYQIRWSPPPPSLPRPAFANKFVEIRNLSTYYHSPTIQKLNFSYLDSEIQPADNESSFSLWRYNGTWYVMNFTLDTAQNFLNTSNIDQFSIIGILQQTQSNVPPVVLLSTPANNTSLANTTIAFAFNATDDVNATMDCSLYLDGYRNATNSSTQNGTLTTLGASGIGNGQHSWHVNCSDGTSAGISGTRYFTVDSTPPQVSLGPPAQSSVLNSSSWAFTITATDNLAPVMSCSLLIDGSVYGTNSSVQNNTMASFTAIGLSDGAHEWNATCTDGTGNTGQSEVRDFTVDTDAPDVYLDEPAASAFLQSPSIDFTFTAVDSLSSSMGCALIIDGTLEDSGTASNDTLEQLSAASLPEGAHLWNVTCADDANNSGTSETRGFTVDLTPPVVALSEPSQDAALNSTLWDFNFTVSDNLASTLSCAIFVDGSMADMDNAVPNDTLKGFGISGLTPGYHTWSVECNDTAQNTGSDGPRDFSVSTEEPAVSLGLPANHDVTNQTTLELSFTATDELDGFLPCSLFIDSIPVWTNGSVQNATAAYHTESGLGQGVHTWNASCNDSAGNAGWSATWDFTVDLDPPHILLEAPAQDAILGSNAVEFSFTPTDVYSTSLDCALIVDSSPLGSYAVPNGTSWNDTRSISEGLHSWYVECTDEAGNTNASAARDFIVDTTGPEITLDSPAPGMAFNDSGMAFNFTATDDYAAYMPCDLLIDGAVYESDPAVQNATPSSFLVFGVSEGAHTWAIQCNDSVNNTGFAGPRNFTVSLTAPAITLAAPSSGSVQPPGAIVFAFSAIDDLDGFMACSLYVDSSQVQSNGSVRNATTTQFTESNLSEGIHSWNVSCNDSAGNAGWSATWDFNISQPLAPEEEDEEEPKPKPELSISIASACDSNTLTVSGPDGPVRGAYVSIDGRDAGRTDAMGQVALPQGCGKSVLAEAEKTGYEDSSGTFAFISCDACVEEPPPTPVCGCGFAFNGTCVDYECCSDSSCEDAEYCDIPSGQIGGACRPASGECGTVANHSFVPYGYQCGTEPGCPSCPADMRCEAHSCVGNGLSCPTTGIVGDNKTCQAMENEGPCANCDYIVTDPTGRNFTGRTGADGNFGLPLTIEGIYKVALMRDGSILKVIEVKAFPQAQPAEPEKPVQASPDEQFPWWLLILLLLIFAAIIYWRRRKKEKNPAPVSAKKPAPSKQGPA